MKIVITFLHTIRFFLFLNTFIFMIIITWENCHYAFTSIEKPQMNYTIIINQKYCCFFKKKINILYNKLYMLFDTLFHNKPTI